MEHLDPFTALLDAYLDGELSPEERSQVQAHLETCPDCRAYLAQWEFLRGRFPTIEDTVVPDGFADGVLKAIRAGTAPQTKHRTFRWKPLLAPIAACLLLVAALPVFQQHQNHLTAASTSADNGIATFSAPAAAASGDESADIAEGAVSPASSDDTGSPESTSEAASESSDSAASSSAADAPADDESLLKSRASANDTEQNTELFSLQTTSLNEDSAVPVDSWIVGENVTFDVTVYLTAEQVGHALDDAVGKPYYEKDADTYVYRGIGYALDEETFSRVLNEVGDTAVSTEVPHSSYCIVVTDD